MLVQMQARRQLAPYQERAQPASPQILECQTMVLSGHEGPVNECKFSPDGKILATCASELIFWSVSKQMTSIGSLKPHKFPITSLSFSADSAFIATSSADKTIAITDTITGKIIRRIKDHGDIINTVDFMKHERDLVVSGDDDGAVLVHDIRQKDLVHKLKSKSPVTTIACSHSYIAVGGVSGGIFVNQWHDNKLNRLFRVDRPNIVYGIAIHPSERFLGAVDADATVSVFDLQPLASSRELVVIPNGKAAREVVPPRIAFSGNGRYMMSGSTDKILRIWDIENPLEPVSKASLPGHQGSVTGVDFHPTELLIASGSTDGTVLVEELSS